MSLLADLLAKVKNPESGMKDVPPGLREIVSSEKNRRRWKLPLLLVLIIGSVAAGFLAIRIADNLHQTSPQAQVKPLPARGEQKALAQQNRVSSATTKRKVASSLPKAPAARKQAVQTVAKQKPVPLPVKTAATTATKPKATVSPVAPARSAPLPQVKPPEQKLAEKTPVKAESSDERYYVFLYAARQYERELKLSAAIEEYRNALRVKPGDPLVLNAMACLYVKLQDFNQGLKHALMSLEGNPGYPPALVNAGICKAKLGDPSGAEELFRAALSSGRFSREGLYNLGLFYEQDRRFEEAVKIYERLVGAGDQDALVHVGRVLELSGKPDEAKTAYRRVVDGGIASKEAKREATRRLKTLQ